jgi:hypothetical protein
MAQSDQTIQNAAFPAVRADINDNLAAIYSQNSGASAPSTTVAFQPWVDTSSSPPVWKIRNAANSAWITVGVLDPTNFQVGGVSPIANGGTGQTTAAAAIAALLPSQTGNADKALVTDGAGLLWSVITSSSFTKYTFAAGSGTGSTRTHTWVKPSSGTTAIVLVWGGGGAGGADNSAGGGGGAGASCGITFLRLADLGATETITIGQGGQGVSSDGNGASGTDSTFGSFVTGYGGVGGDDDDSEYAVGARWFGTQVKTNDPSFSVLSNRHAEDILSGGTGGRSNSGDNAQLGGGQAYFGGGGGGGAKESENTYVAPGGTSVIGGNGGNGRAGSNDGGAGSIPGGGGGGVEDGIAGSGGDGECWVLIF